MGQLPPGGELWDNFPGGTYMTPFDEKWPGGDKQARTRRGGLNERCLFPSHAPTVRHGKKCNPLAVGHFRIPLSKRIVDF